MALQGNWTYTTQEIEEGNFNTISVTYPEDLPENDPNYNFRGQTKEIEVPVYKEITETYDNVYINIQSIHYWKSFKEQEKFDLMNITYRVFSSRESYLSNPQDYLIEKHSVAQHIDFSKDLNHMEQAYEILKNTIGFQDLISV